MKRVLSLLLSLMLLFPVCSNAEEIAPPALSTDEVVAILFDGIVEILSGTKPGLDMTLTSPEGEAVSAAFGLTESGFAAKASKPGFSIGFNEANAYIADDAGAASVPLQSLLTMLLTGDNGAALPIPTETELNALAAIGQELVASLPGSGSLSWSISNHMFSLHIDLDKLVAHLVSYLPDALSRHAAQVDSLLAKVTPFLFGKTITRDQLLNDWVVRGLKGLRSTGLVLDVVLFESGNTYSLMASCASWSLKAEMNEFSLNLALTAPNGTVYNFDTKDMLTVISLLRSFYTYLPGDCLEIATYRMDGARSSTYTQTTTIALDFDLLLKELQQAQIQLFTIHGVTIDYLIDKYLPWADVWADFMLASGLRASRPNIRRVSAAEVVSDLQSINLSSPCKLDAAIVYDSSKDTYDGYCHIIEEKANTTRKLLLLEGWYTGTIGARRQCNVSLRMPEKGLALTLSGSASYTYTSFTLECSADLGGFHRISYAERLITPYISHTAITTDTDVFHYIEDDKGFDLKLGSYALECQFVSGRDFLHARWPNGYLDFEQAGDDLLVESPWFGLDIRSRRRVTTVDGYLAEYPSRPDRFHLMIDPENQVTLSILPYFGGNAHLTYRPGCLTLLTEGSELSLTDAGQSSATQNTALLTLDGERIATIVTEVEREEDFLFRVYLSKDDSAPCWTLQLDIGAAGPTFPADALPLTPAEYLQRVNDALHPATDEPHAEERPMEDLPNSTNPTVTE